MLSKVSSSGKLKPRKWTSCEFIATQQILTLWEDTDVSVSDSSLMTGCPAPVMTT